MSLGRRIAAVTVLNLATNLVALAKNGAIAARFGVSGNADIVAYAESALLFLPTLLLVRECFGLFISVYGRLLETQGRDEAASLYAGGLRGVLAIGGTLSLVVLLFPTGLMRCIAPGLAPEQLQRGAWLLRWVSPALVLQEIAEFTRTVHNAHHRYAVPGLVMLFGNVVQTAFLVSLPTGKAMTAWVLGIDGAALLQASLLVGIAHRFSGHGMRNAPLLHPELRRLGRLVAPVALGVVLVQLAGYIERAVLSYLPPGSLATLAYSRKLIAPLQTVLAASVAIPLYVTISRSVEPGGGDRAATFSRGIEINLFLFVPLTVLVLMLAPEIVELAFRRGLFIRRDVAPTALMLRIGVLAVLPGSIVMLLRDFLYASSRTRPLVLGGLIHLVVTAVANLAIAPHRGIAWIAVGVVTGTWLSCLVLFLFVRARVPWERWRDVLRGGGIVLLGAPGIAVAVRVALLVNPPKPAAGLLHSLWILIAATVAGLLVYGATASLLGHPLARRLIEKLRGRAV